MGNIIIEKYLKTIRESSILKLMGLSDHPEKMTDAMVSDRYEQFKRNMAQFKKMLEKSQTKDKEKIIGEVNRVLAKAESTYKQIRSKGIQKFLKERNDALSLDARGVNKSKIKEDAR